jgi:hypothetical protein
MRLTSSEEIEWLKVEMLMLKAELDGYLLGHWTPEYHLTIGYNRVYTGRKRYTGV